MGGPAIARALTALTALSRSAQDKREQPAVHFNGRLKRPNGVHRTDPSRPKTFQGVWRVESGRFHRPVLHFLSYASQRRVIILPTTKIRTDSYPACADGPLWAVRCHSREGREQLIGDKTDFEHGPAIGYCYAAAIWIRCRILIDWRACRFPTGYGYCWLRASACSPHGSPFRGFWSDVFLHSLRQIIINAPVSSHSSIYRP